MNDMKNNDHFLTRPKTVRGLIWAGLIVLTLTIAAQFAIDIEGRFSADNWFGFGAVFGFFSCVAMVVGAKALGRLLKRDESYYDD